jgi:hypothetical protein
MRRKKRLQLSNSPISLPLRNNQGSGGISNGHGIHPPHRKGKKTKRKHENGYDVFHILPHTETSLRDALARGKRKEEELKPGVPSLKLRLTPSKNPKADGMNHTIYLRI